MKIGDGHFPDNILAIQELFLSLPLGRAEKSQSWKTLSEFYLGLGVTRHFCFPPFSACKAELGF